MPYGQVDRICKLVPNNPAKPVTLQQALESEQLLKEQYAADEEIKRLIDLALQLEGLYRNASTHAAGVVIGDRPLDQLVPLYRDTDDKESLPATQFNMKWVEHGGPGEVRLPRPQDADRDREGLRADRRGDKIDIAKMPLDDEPTFKMLAKGDAYGVFQMEGSGMRDILAKLKPNRFEDLIALVALYRPGPMDDIPTYISVKNGRGEARLPAPTLKPHPGRDLRHHGLPGAGDADRPGPVGLFAGRRRPAAPRHGQEDQVGDGRAAQALRRRRRQARRRAGPRRR